jgi:aspartyl-tRNA(Asn)/glutamyl-tRNA(Gln) amidotransferase subunit C
VWALSFSAQNARQTTLQIPRKRRPQAILDHRLNGPQRVVFNPLCYPTDLAKIQQRSPFAASSAKRRAASAPRFRFMSLTPQDIERIAHLARIRVTPADVADVQTKLDGIFKLIDEMQTVNTTGVEPMSHGLDMVLRLRDDVVTEHNQREHFQKNAPQAENGYFLVPRVIE